MAATKPRRFTTSGLLGRVGALLTMGIAASLSWSRVRPSHLQPAQTRYQYVYRAALRPLVDAAYNPKLGSFWQKPYSVSVPRQNWVRFGKTHPHFSGIQLQALPKRTRIWLMTGLS